MDKAKKKQIKKITTWVLLAAMVAGLAAMPLLAKAEAEADGPVASVLSGTVEEGSISTALHGGGTLSVEDIAEIKIPSGVKITEFLVKNGETVSAGSPLAAVDKVSVMTAITAVTETMEYLQEEMRSAKEEKVSANISATAGGRVKKVFARKGDSVQDVMLQHGALALLSLDGLMAVELQRDMELPTGQSVEVIFPDKTEASGRVESNLDGVIVITVEDEGYPIGETVTVFTNDGDRVGSGELQVHNAWTATAYSGTIQTVYAKEESKVSSGASLFALTDRDFRGDLEYLASLHREYEQLMQDLFKMYNSGTIDAPCDGMVSGVDKDSAHLLSAEGGDDFQVELLTNRNEDAEPEWTVVLLSNVVMTSVTACDPSQGENCPETILENHLEDCPKYCHNNATCDGIDQHYPACIKLCNPGEDTKDCGRDASYHHKLECIKSCTHASAANQCKSEAYPHYLDCIYSCTKSDGTKDCVSLKHWPGCIESCTHADTTDACTATACHYADCIKSCIVSESGSATCPASKHHAGCFFYGMTYQAKVYLVDSVGSTALVVRKDSSEKSYPVVKVGSNWKFVNAADFNPQLLVNQGTLSVSNPSAYQPGDVILVITGYQGDTPVWSDVDVYTKITAGSGSTGLGSLGDLSALLGGLAGLKGMTGLGGLGSFGFVAETPVEEEALFDLEGSVLMTVSPETTASLSITLDEQDIAKVSVGQKATVKVEALDGETFDAEVVEISNHGTNSGGSSKFTVKLRFNKAADMIDGMSATASLPLETREAIPVIPVAALAEQGTQTVVYTALDAETGEPANPVPVTVGVSDGENAEILEGLALGDTYYYSYYDTLEEDTGVEERFTLT